MSAKLMGMVWDLDLPHSEQSVLLALADHADHDGGNIYPGVDLIAWKTGYSVRQVQRILRTLEDMQLVIPTSGKGGRGKTTAYELHLEKGVKKSPFRRAKGDTTSPIPIKGVSASPIEPINGDMVSPITEERVTFSTLKGDISSILNGSEPRQDQAPHAPNHHRTINTEILKGRVDIDEDVVGASPPVVVGVPSSLCAEIARAAGTELKADALKRLIEQHPTLDASRLVFEAEMAAEWIADPTKNRSKPKRQMSVRFLHNWYARAEQSQEDHAHETRATAATGTYAATAHTGSRTRRAAAEPPDPTKHGIYASSIRRD